MILSFLVIFIITYLILSVLLPARIQRKGVCLMAVMATVVIEQIFLHTRSLAFLSSFFGHSKVPISQMRLYYPIGFAFTYAFFAFVLSRKVSRKAVVLLALITFMLIRVCDLDSTFFATIESTKIPLYLMVVQGAGILILVLFLLLTAVEIFCSLAGKALPLFAKKDAELSSPFSSDDRLSAISGTESVLPVETFSIQRRTFLKMAMATVPAVYGVKEAVLLPKVKPMDLALNTLPEALDGLRIVQITDLHISILFEENWVKGVVERVNNLQPDVILFTGDMTDGTPAQRKKGVRPLSDLVARYGILGCMGNHDYYSDYSGWMKMFPHLGITILENSHQVIPIGGANLVVAGVPDIVAENYNLPTPDPKAALANMPADAFCIMLDHRPINATKNARAGAHLQLSGHTHGGQILGMDLIVKEKNNGFVRGWYTVNNMPMYVGSGAGLWSGFPIRLGVPSELPCITLHKA